MLSGKIITVDGTFRSGLSKGTHLTAVAQDGKDQIILLAYAIVESENLDIGNLFLNLLNINFNINHGGIILISDRGLKFALETILLLSIKSHCVRYLFANLKPRFRNKILLIKFWALAYTYNNKEF